MPLASSASGTSLLVAGALCLLPFLVPYHQQPILSFFPEWLAGALGAAAVLARIGSQSAPIAGLPLAARWLTGFAVFLFARAGSGGLAYPSASVLMALYVLYAAALLWLGMQLVADLGIERVALVLAAFALAGALANAAAGVVQYYGRPAFLEDVVADLHGPGAYGNIAQRNLYADYLALGEGALALLWLRGRASTACALIALALLAWASALSGSRGALVYALWYAAVGWIAAKLSEGAEARRLRLAGSCIAGATLAALVALPLVNQLFLLNAPGTGALDRIHASDEPIRWKLAVLALQLFGDAPWIGVGPGEFAGAALELGIDPALAAGGEIWTSPHNLLLHLLVETGMIGALLGLGGLCLWGWQALLRYRRDPQPALWWLLAAAGVVLIHSLTEFPLWSAHFLGVAALLVGASSEVPARSFAGPRTTRFGMAASCIALSLVLAILLRDYVRIDRARVTGTTITLAPAPQAGLDAATMRDLTHGLLGPVAELWIVLGAPLDRDELSAKREMSARVARYWPANSVIARQAVFLALDGEAEKARAALGRALRSYPGQREATLYILRQAYPADPAAIEPLLAMSRRAKAAP
jgi:O-antigen ligase